MADADFWELARTCCTDDEFEILAMNVRKAMSIRTIAVAKNLSRTTVRDKLARAQQKVARASEQAA